MVEKKRSAVWYLTCQGTSICLQHKAKHLIQTQKQKSFPDKSGNGKCTQVKVKPKTPSPCHGLVFSSLTSQVPHWNCAMLTVLCWI